MEEVLRKTTATATASPTSFPTVTPDLPTFYFTDVATDTGKRTLWVVTVFMALSSLAFYGMAMRVPVQKRLFHVLTAFITTIAFISYFAMASGDGINFHVYKEKPTKHHTAMEVYSRQVYWARYVDVSLDSDYPLLLADLSFLAGLNGASMLVAIFADVIMVLTGLFAAFGASDGQKWGYYTMGCAAYLVIVYQLAINGRTAISNKDTKTKTFFTMIAGYTLLLWTAYPIVWGIGDGARLMNVDAEVVCYAILDVLAKPIFGFWLLTTHDKMSRNTASIEGFWAHGLTQEGAIRVGDGA
ncbi:hypothetical protein PG996_010016 [Apiospora saccharicola]|uniref:Opsin-1 n=1 Tax=Apiospora saccharicola TaxID=335842 RepID=A0ABR1UMF3_9PEZI